MQGPRGGGGEEGFGKEACKLWQHKDMAQWGRKKSWLSSTEYAGNSARTHQLPPCEWCFVSVMHTHQYCCLHAGPEQHNHTSTWAEYKRASALNAEEYFLPRRLPPNTLPPLARGSTHSARTSQPLCWDRQPEGRVWTRLSSWKLSYRLTGVLPGYIIVVKKSTWNLGNFELWKSITII